VCDAQVARRWTYFGVVIVTSTHGALRHVVLPV